MYSRDKTYSSTDLDDFSSVFMHANSTEQVSAMQMLDQDTTVPASHNANYEQSLNENQNLSNIISHIRDQGSAKLHANKTAPRSRDTVQRIPAKPVEKTAHYHQAIQPDPVSNEEVEMPAVKSTENNQVKKGHWLPLVLSLALAVTAVMGFNLYQLNEQANEMKATLITYEDQIDDLSYTQEKSSSTLVKVSTINEELAGLKQELQAIKTDYASKMVQRSSTTQEPQEKAIANVKQEVSDLENSLVSTLIEMTAMKQTMNEVKKALVEKEEAIAITETAQTEGQASKKEMTKNDAATASGWVVNLASLSSKEQALIGVSMLEKSGLAPIVQQVKVNGETVYRLIVEGFSTRDEAMLFISEAKKQYGFEGGWVWQA